MHKAAPDTDLDLLKDLGYDPRDVNYKETLKWFGIFAAFVIVSIFVALFFFTAFAPEYKKEKQLPAYVNARRLPPYPQLQAEPKPEYEVYINSQEPKLKQVEAVMASMAESGISGVKGSTHKEEGGAYPGSGKYAGASESGEHHSDDSHEKGGHE